MGDGRPQTLLKGLDSDSHRQRSLRRPWVKTIVDHDVTAPVRIGCAVSDGSYVTAHHVHIGPRITTRLIARCSAKPHSSEDFSRATRDSFYALNIIRNAVAIAIKERHVVRSFSRVMHNDVAKLALV
jgi:hypothetical protein